MANSIINAYMSKKWKLITGYTDPNGYLDALNLLQNGEMLYVNLTTKSDKTIAEGNTIFVLPVGSRPVSIKKALVWNYTADKVYQLSVSPNGNVTLYGKGTATGRLTGDFIVILS
jgi:hypothetical protein